MGWLFGKKPRREVVPKVIESAIPRDEERYGPTPPPPRTAHAPGVTVHAFAKIPEPRLLRFGSGDAGFFFDGHEAGGRASALLILMASGAALAGDVLLFSPSYSFEEISRTSPPPQHHIRLNGLSGRGVAGLAGLRTLHAGDGLTVLRLGPPPGARWVFVGLRAIAVFAGRLTLVDGEESRLVSAGQLALIADSTATLYVEAGNDSALAVALGESAVVSALG
jgi:hypothetical protein